MTDQHEPEQDRPVAEPEPPPAGGDDLGGPTQRLARPEAARPDSARPEAVRPDSAPPEAEPPEAEPPGDGPTQRLVPPGEGPTRRLALPADDATPPPESPETVTSEKDVPEEKPEERPAKPAPWRRLSSAGALIWVLLALFGFTLVVQLRSNDGDQGLATARQEDLVRILSDLEARDSRLQSEISALETSQRQLTSGVAGRQAALAEAEKRADELGLLAGTLPGRGPGLQISLDKVKASAILNAVQELRGAGGEVMQLAGAGGTAVRIVASSYFVDAEGGGIVVDGERLAAPYTLLVIGAPSTMQTALQIPGGVVASVNSAGGSVTMEQRSTVEVTAVRTAKALQYARPAS